MSPPVTIAAGARAVEFDGPGVIVLVDTSGGTVQTLMEPAATWWRTLAATGNRHTAARTAGMSAGEANGLQAALLAAGILTPAPRSTPWPAPLAGHDPGPSWGTRTAPVALAVSPQPRRPARIAASAGLIAAVLLTRIGPSHRSLARHLTLVRAVTRWNALRRAPQADMATATEAVQAIRRIARWCPTRAACLEQTTAAHLLLALRGYGATWCQGVAPDPVRLHAWVEQTDTGRHVDEPAETTAYTLILRIPGRRSPSA
ncbi:lasso peptide biosynthesis B2 protein [Embleya sp. NPDC056575]|uniref:lasso peptide biosynthesis B2 protein n=1 Tax=unclassified Embleya TaxID=2699296 RepID=UPI0036AD9E13